MATGIMAGTKELWNSREADNTARGSIQHVDECSQSGRRTNRVVQDHSRCKQCCSNGNTSNLNASN